MKFNQIFILVLIATIVLGALWYDHKVSKLLDQLATAVGKTDTVKVVLTVHDTTYVQHADTIVSTADTTIVGDTIIIDHNKNLVGITEQPLFVLRVDVNTKLETFKYDFKYKPLSIFLEFKDKYDLRKGFKAYTVPDVGNVNVSFGDYTPLKKKFGLSLAGGALLLDNNPGLMAGISFKKNELGMLWMEGKRGFYYRRVLFEF